MVCTDHFVLCKAALVFSVTRWVFSRAQSLVKHYMFIFSWSLEFDQEPENPAQSSSTVGASPASIALVKDHLSSTTFGDLSRRLLPKDDDQESRSHAMSCVVCLQRFKKKDRVWDLSNCRHVFHEECLNRWLDYDARLSCPLCRTALIAMSSEPSSSAPQQPSWAVERILYLFGDDLLCSPSYSSSSTAAVEDQTYSCLLPCYSS